MLQFFVVVFVVVVVVVVVVDVVVVVVVVCWLPCNTCNTMLFSKEAWWCGDVIRHVL